MPQRYFLLGISPENHEVARLIYQTDPRADIAILVRKGEAALGSRSSNLLVTGYIEALRHIPPQRLVLCAVTDPYQKLTLLSEVPPEYQFATVIADSSRVSQTSHVAPGTIVYGDTIIAEGCTIGPHCLIRTRVTLDNNMKLGAYSVVGTRTIIGSSSTVGSGVKIGHDVIIYGQMDIGAWSEIAPASCVMKGIPHGGYAQGNPATVVHKNPGNAYTQ